MFLILCLLTLIRCSYAADTEANQQMLQGRLHLDLSQVALESPRERAKKGNSNTAAFLASYGISLLSTTPRSADRGHKRTGSGHLALSGSLTPNKYGNKHYLKLLHKNHGDSDKKRSEQQLLDALRLNLVARYISDNVDHSINAKMCLAHLVEKCSIKQTNEEQDWLQRYKDTFEHKEANLSFIAVECFGLAHRIYNAHQQKSEELFDAIEDLLGHSAEIIIHNNLDNVASYLVIEHIIDEIHSYRRKRTEHHFPFSIGFAIQPILDLIEGNRRKLAADDAPPILQRSEQE